MADNIEHVISYWVVFETFHSNNLQGFAVISHWVPQLLLAGFTGAWADRFDIRRLIQVGMVMFMGVSITWGILFMTNSVTIWNSCLLLVIHGMAGVIWAPAGQVLIYQIVGMEQLPGAVRMTATGRYLGMVCGPAVGGLLLLVLGPSKGIIINALIYLPMFLWMILAPYGRAAPGGQMTRPALRGFADIWATMKVVRNHHVLMSMTVLIGAASFFIGNAYQAQMPEFAIDLGFGHATDISYSILLAADAAGGLIGGLMLESRSWLAPQVKTAYWLVMIWCGALFGFAQSHTYPLAVFFLFIAGFVELGFNSMAQALVQINAPSAIRGRVIGVFSMAAMGLRTFSGLGVGVLGAAIGVHLSLSLCAASLLVVAGWLYVACSER